RLQKTPGCICAHLAASEEHPGEGISMTLWRTREAAEEYEKSGLFEELLALVRPFLSDSSEWKVQLSKDLKLEVQPLPEEPVVKSYDTSAGSDSSCASPSPGARMYLRIVSVKIRPGKMERLRRVYAEEIAPALSEIPGCRFAYLTESTEKEDEAISVTIWDSKKDADEYEASGRFMQLLEKIEDTFTELYQWKMTLGGKRAGKVTTSEDLAVESYRVVTGRRFD
ncbi:MAG: antibiotic biosynthesis monooxygenase family protein, partial [Candidatus Eisenbacteria bacterium]